MPEWQRQRAEQCPSILQNAGIYRYLHTFRKIITAFGCKEAIVSRSAPESPCLPVASALLWLAA